MKRFPIGFSLVALSVLAAIAAGALVAGCAHGPEVKQQAYAKLRDQRTFETGMPEVWKAIEAVFRNYRVSDRDPSKVDAVEMKKLRARALETDWIITQSRDKYVEYKVNDSPRKKYLQTRLKYKVRAETVIGGVQVAVKTTEEVERLKDDGSPDGWDSMNEIDTSRPAEILDKIDMGLISAPAGI